MNKVDATRDAGMASAVLSSPPRGDCYRALAEAPELKGDTSPVMFGRFAEFETWTEINSILEGHFFERVAPTAFAKTIREDRDRIRVLFHHGRDASVGFQVLGTIDELHEDSYHVVGLFEAVPPLILDGLRAGQYGSSYRFATVKHEWVSRPRRSDRNPKGIPELTILEARVREFGPTPIPQYPTGAVGVRSVTDDLALEAFAQDPQRIEAMLRDRSMISVPDLGGVTEKDRVASSDREYRRSVEMVGSSVWAITPEMLGVIVGIIGERANGIRPTREEIQARIGARAEESEPNDSSVAVIPIHGPIVPRADLLDEVSGAVSIENLQETFRDAVADENVSAILLDIDSPGGDAKMIPEMAAEIMAARGSKPIVAVANSMAASAAYWLATAADELIVTPSGEVGSIGVYTAHADISAAQEKAGIKTTLVSAGDYKVERNPFAPLSEDAESAMQERVDTIYDAFVAAVATGRGVDAETVQNDFGKGRLLLATSAVKAGMADKVDTFTNTLKRLEKSAESGERSEPEPPEVTTPEPEPSEATTHPGPSSDEPTVKSITPLWGVDDRDRKETPEWRL
jgi:signal peptide peptidase SppA